MRSYIEMGYENGSEVYGRQARPLSYYIGIWAKEDRALEDLFSDDYEPSSEDLAAEERIMKRVRERIGQPRTLKGYVTSIYESTKETFRKVQEHIGKIILS